MINMSNKKLRVIVDLDGTICELRKTNETYSEVLPKAGAIEFLKKLKSEGHTIVIYTARNMGSQDHNIGKVLKNIGLITLEWLDKYQIPYDEIFFGKPNGDIIIDDRAMRLDSWDAVDLDKIIKLSKEK